MFNMLSGGSLGRMSIFALGLMPYITSSIVIQLMSFIVPEMSNMRKDGELGKRKINQITRYVTILLSIFQSFGIANGMLSLNSSYGSLVVIEENIFIFMAIISLATGTLFLMWLGETISKYKLGNGTSIIIFAGIVSGLPSSLVSMFQLSRSGAVSIIGLLLIICLSILVIYAVVFMEKSYRKLPVHYSNRQVGNKMYKGESSYLPIKVNISGVIPPIFASSVLLFPLTIVNFYSSSELGFASDIAAALGHGKPMYIFLYTILVIFFAFFYTSVVFNPEETCENIKKNGGFFPNRRPGKASASYLDFVITRITCIGAVYLCIICLLPEFVVAKFGISMYLGGTSVLIIISVIIDCISQIQSRLFYNKYQTMLKKTGFRG